MELLKDKLASRQILSKVAHDIKHVYSELPLDDFLRDLLADLEKRELKNRIIHLAGISRVYLPAKYSDALKVLYRFIQGKSNRFIYVFLPTFVMLYGRKNYKLSIKALRDFTETSTSEEGIRPFLEDDLKGTLQHMIAWTKSSNPHIRRLASEGCRPRLPWASKIESLIKNPKHTYPILCALNKDPHKYVQKSVANHINDISKDHPDWIVEKLSGWDCSDPATLWIVKHGLRTLIKRGHKKALRIFNSDKKPKILLTEIRYDSKIQIGKKWSFSFKLASDQKTPQQLMVDYKIHFFKKNGTLNAKTFKLKSFCLKPSEEVVIKKTYHFKNYSTRQHYPGQHRWELTVNGESQFIKSMTLLGD